MASMLRLPNFRIKLIRTRVGGAGRKPRDGCVDIDKLPSYALLLTGSSLAFAGAMCTSRHFQPRMMISTNGEHTDVPAHPLLWDSTRPSSQRALPSLDSTLNVSDMEENKWGETLRVCYRLGYARS